ncbi:hypothetical protein ACN42_g8351 [Penicillium freii]|uniref:Uncharacterized protein n=1 Tax=Penicillium freii TaxID=48697 RepID=A0A101MDY8_PENFR|nr:hypothetical protein ACN42_g8351 [Penicillium freii]
MVDFNLQYTQRKYFHRTKMKTYNSEDSLVVTHPTTNSPACGLSTAERTGSPVFHTLWSYVTGYVSKGIIECQWSSVGRRLG